MSPFGHPMEVSTQVQLVASWDYLRVQSLRVALIYFVDLPQVSAASEPGSECERIPLLSDHSSSSGGVSSVRWRSLFNSNHIRGQVLFL